MKVAVELSPRRTQRHTEFRRGATVDSAAINVQFKRRSATRHVSQPPFRGLKSTATIGLSLRDGRCSATRLLRNKHSTTHFFYLATRTSPSMLMLNSWILPVIAFVVTFPPGQRT